jgi:hypothetical protein
VKPAQNLSTLKRGGEAPEMSDNAPEFFQGTEMPTAGWWEALWPDPAGVLTAVGIKRGMAVIDLCSGDELVYLENRQDCAAGGRHRY